MTSKQRIFSGHQSESHEADAQISIFLGQLGLWPYAINLVLDILENDQIIH